MFLYGNCTCQTSLRAQHSPYKCGKNGLVILACRLGQQLKLVLLNLFISSVVNIPSMPIFLLLFRLVATMGELQQR